MHLERPLSTVTAGDRDLRWRIPTSDVLRPVLLTGIAPKGKEKRQIIRIAKGLPTNNWLKSVVLTHLGEFPTFPEYCLSDLLVPSTLVPCVVDCDLHPHAMILTHMGESVLLCLVSCVEDGHLHPHPDPVIHTHNWIPLCLSGLHSHPMILTHRWIPTPLWELSVWSPCPLCCSVLCKRWWLPLLAGWNTWPAVPRSGGPQGSCQLLDRKSDSPNWRKEENKVTFCR